MPNRILIFLAAAAAFALLLLLLFQRGEPARVTSAPRPTQDARPALPGQSGAAIDREPAIPAERVLAGAAEDAAKGPGAGRPGPEELWGRVVVAGSSAAVAGADVRLLHRDADEFSNLDLEYGEQVTELAQAISDAEGRFRFGVQRARAHRISVRAAGFAPVVVQDCLGGSEVVVELSAGATLEGIVRCEGAGLPGTPLRVAVAGKNIELAAGRTERGGSFRFEGLQAADVYLQVQPSDHAGEWKRVTLAPGGVHRVEVDLDRGKVARGRVIEAATRAPIVMAEVSDSWTFRRRVRTDGEGRFELAGIRDQGYAVLYVRAAGYTTATQNLAGRVEQEVEFALTRGGQVTGRFVSQSGEPVPGAYAAAGASYMEAPGMGHTDWIRAQIERDGRFRVAGLRPDLHYSLYVRAHGCGSRVYLLAKMLGEGERLDIGDVVLRAAGGVEGRVVGDGGAPLAGVEVSISGANADSGRWLAGRIPSERVSQFHNREVDTDRAGMFRFTSLAAGEYWVRVQPGGRPQRISRKVQVEDGAILEGIELVVPAGSVLEGVLVYGDGRELGDAAAEFHLNATGPDGDSYMARPEPGGRFRFTGVSDGGYTISLFRGPKGWSLSPRTDVRSGTKDLRLVLLPAARIAGKVLGPDGSAAKAQIWVRADSQRGGVPLHASSDDGTFEVEVPHDFQGSIGAHDVREWTTQSESKKVTAGQTDLVLQLREQGALPGLRRR